MSQKKHKKRHPQQKKRTGKKPRWLTEKRSILKEERFPMKM